MADVFHDGRYCCVRHQGCQVVCDQLEARLRPFAVNDEREYYKPRQFLVGDLRARVKLQEGGQGVGAVADNSGKGLRFVHRRAGGPADNGIDEKIRVRSSAGVTAAESASPFA